MKRFILVFCILLVLILSLYYVLFGSARSKFKKLLVCPIPDSVEILNCSKERNGFDATVWLHFKISQDDFKFILFNNYYRSSNDLYLKEERIQNSPSWWQPWSLYKPIYFWYDGKLCLYRMWVNSNHTEVYFKYLDY